MNPDKRTILPSMAFRGFASRYQQPQLSEGFQDITEVAFKVRSFTCLYWFCNTHWSSFLHSVSGEWRRTPNLDTVLDMSEWQSRYEKDAVQELPMCAVHVRNPYRLHSNHGYFPYSHGYTRQPCLNVGVIGHAIYLPSRCRGTWNDPFLKASCTAATFHKSSNSRRILLRFCQFHSAAPLFSTVFGPQRSRTIHELQPTFAAADGKRLRRIKFLQNWHRRLSTLGWCN